MYTEVPNFSEPKPQICGTAEKRGEWGMGTMGGGTRGGGWGGDGGALWGMGTRGGQGGSWGWGWEDGDFKKWGLGTGGSRMGAEGLWGGDGGMRGSGLGVRAWVGVTWPQSPPCWGPRHLVTVADADPAVDLVEQRGAEQRELLRGELRGCIQPEVQQQLRHIEALRVGDAQGWGGAPCGLRSPRPHSRSRVRGRIRSGPSPTRGPAAPSPRCPHPIMPPSGSRCPPKLQATMGTEPSASGPELCSDLGSKQPNSGPKRTKWKRGGEMGENPTPNGTFWPQRTQTEPNWNHFHPKWAFFRPKCPIFTQN